jgi:hypothetical protein
MMKKVQRIKKGNEKFVNIPSGNADLSFLASPFDSHFFNSSKEHLSYFLMIKNDNIIYIFKKHSTLSAYFRTLMKLKQSEQVEF